MTINLTGRSAQRPLHDPPLVRAHARWILLVTVVAVLSACVLPLLVQGLRYTSEAEVLVAAVGTAGGAAAPAMETEVQVVGSAAVLTPVAEEIGSTLRRLQRDVAATVPPESTVLVVRYSDADRARAQQGAQAVVDAYIDYRGAAVTVLSPATRPQGPSSPDFLLNASAGLVLGLLLGVGSALVRDRLDDGVRGPQDVEQRTGLPVLATVPAAHPADPADAGAAEAYRIVRTKVERAVGTGGALVAVAGSAEDDSAARTAEGLAVALARAGAQVVLVDTDLRTAAGTAGTAGTAGANGTDGGGAGVPGLADVLRGHAALPDVLRDGPVPRLRLVGPGRSPSGVEDLLAGPAALGVLQGLRAGADHVVVHVPPVLAAAEALVITGDADLVVLSAVVGATTRRVLTAAVLEVGADRRLLGCVLHDAPGAEPVPPATAPEGDRPRAAQRARRLPARGDGVPAPERPLPDVADGERTAAAVVERR